MPDKPDLDRLRASLTDAEEEANRVLLADDFALTNGAYARAMNVVHACRLELMAAEVSASCGVIRESLGAVKWAFAANGYQRITEDEHAASASTCGQCGGRTRLTQAADDTFTCADCAEA